MKYNTGTLVQATADITGIPRYCNSARYSVRYPYPAEGFRQLADKRTTQRVRAPSHIVQLHSIQHIHVWYPVHFWRRGFPTILVPPAWAHSASAAEHRPARARPGNTQAVKGYDARHRAAPRAGAPGRRLHIAIFGLGVHHRPATALFAAFPPSPAARCPRFFRFGRRAWRLHHLGLDERYAPQIPLEEAHLLFEGLGLPRGGGDSACEPLPKMRQNVALHRNGGPQSNPGSLAPKRGVQGTALLVHVRILGCGRRTRSSAFVALVTATSLSSFRSALASFSASTCFLRGSSSSLSSTWLGACGVGVWDFGSGGFGFVLVDGRSFGVYDSQVFCWSERGVYAGENERSGGNE